MWHPMLLNDMKDGLIKEQEETEHHYFFQISASTEYSFRKPFMIMQVVT